MNNQENNILENVPVIDITQEGMGVAKIEGLVYFIRHAIPGDVVNIQVSKKRRKVAEARLIEIVKPSDDRTTPHCEHFGTCGGCTLQHITYAAQLRFKQKQVEDALIRIGKVGKWESEKMREGETEHLLTLPLSHSLTFFPILGAQQTTFYRNRLEYTFSNKRWLNNEEINDTEISGTGGFIGFHAAGIFYKVIDINKCWHQPDPSNAMRLWIKQYGLDHDLPFFDIMKQEGLLRNVSFRNATTGQWMVTFVFYHEDEKIKPLLESFVQQFPEITSVQYIINHKRNSTIYDLPVHTFKGPDHIFEKMENLQFKISAKSFYQTNSKQAYELYKIARDFADLKGDELVYDLYTGTGTIALFVSSKAKQVIGIDHTEDAIKDAEVNAQINGISNAKFFAGDLKDTMNDEFVAAHGMPDVVITDPPRAGMHPHLVQKLLEVAPAKIVYVSCNPSTQARDIAMLDEKYKVMKVQPVDMFPHTAHVENVVLLVRK